MKFSICSWTFGNEPIEKVMKFVSETGYDAIEIRAAVNEYNWKELLRLSKDLSLDIGGLTGDTGWPCEEQDLANRSAAHRQRAVEYFKRQIEAVKEVEGSYLVVCPSAVGKTALMGNPGEDWKWAVDSVQKLTDQASEWDVTLVIEPLNRYESCIVNTAEHALQFVQEVGHPNVKTLLDSYHMNVEEKDMETPFFTVKDHLEILHVADSNRQALGRGHINFAPFVSGIQKAAFNGTVVVECCAPGANPFQADKGHPAMEWIYTYATESLAYLKKHFRS
ncbi:sugar phosphate isomerase/epimerase [Paenibacillus validus]|uniref:TIM barrel protein n=1 Tax=Paenibacillus validus TaxID=44253 RepID=A0A7X2ZC97_9BACL|nr:MULTISPECIES: sugar phosphate isomerase/epimerase [Paenibacillus]MED4599130.1 sugar phosphate isomerase/epimerase [Paenibacillus validus]MED4605413.1 sugar phosphate isomerase/epimerase [Paenibacillus validus]MUG72330.1 TIM barrel protein [Paenibacillus validus]